MTPLRPFDDELGGVTFVQASAGTGKTYAIEMLYLRLLVEAGLTPEQIVVVTYTNAAAAELRDRVRGRVHEALQWVEGAGADAEAKEDWQSFLARQESGSQVRRCLLAALYGFDRASISTIHSFCQRVLQEHAFDSGTAFNVEMVADQTALVDEVVRDFVAAHLHEAPEYVLDEIWGSHGYSGLTRFAALVAGQPDLVVAPPVTDVEADKATWEAVFDRAHELWQQDSAGILELTAGNDALHKNTNLKAAEIERGLADAFGARVPFAGRRYPALKKFDQDYLVSKTKKKFEPPRHEFFDCCGALLEIESRLSTATRAVYFARLADFARREIPRRKAEAGVFFFDDLLLKVRDALGGANGAALADKLRERFRAALIDEFQDTDQVQYTVFKGIFMDEERPLFLIGDPKQSIYSFRGADVHAYVGASADAARESTLGTNRRSSDLAVGAVNRLFGVSDAFVLPEIRFDPVESTGEIPELDASSVAGVRFLWCEAPDESAKVEDFRRKIQRGVASRIVELLDSGATIDDKAVRPSDIAVLCRKNDQAAEIQLELRRRGVPTVLTGDRSVFETPEALEMARVLSALADPRDATLIRVALCTPLCGLSGDELFALQEDETGWQMWIERFRRWRLRWDEYGFMAAFGSLRDECDTAARLLSWRGGERQLTNYLHLAELLQVASRELRSGPQGLVDWLRLMSSEGGAGGEMAGEAVQVRLESDADAVVLTTVHKSKGLEYPVVFLPYLWTPPRTVAKTLVEHHDPVAGRSVWVGPVAPDGVTALAAEQAAGEEMRLAYVAMTRAKQCTFVVAPAYSRIKDSPLHRLLGSVDRERLEEEVRGAAGSIVLEDLAVTQDRVRASRQGIELTEPPQPVAVVADWRVSSFSGLTSGAEGLSAQEEDGIDLDEVRPTTSEDESAAAGREVTLADLESGTRIGLMIHSIFEDLDFRMRDPDRLRKLVGDKTEAFAAGGRYVTELTKAIDEVSNVPLPGLGGEFRLADVESARRLDELEFILPVSGVDGADLTPGRLADVLRAHGAPSASPDYADRVGSLGFGAFSGFLRGFIDMAFEHSGRWYVVDYKSNFLGRHYGDYEASRLLGPMRHHDYFLQYLLYVVATHRYLSQRLPDYSYERDFGGVFYLFLRGMDAGVPGAGVFHDRPSAELVSALSALFEDGGGRG